MNRMQFIARLYSPNQPRDERGRWTSGGALEKAVKYLEKHAAKDYRAAEKPTLKNKCAELVRTALEQDGIYIGQHGSAKNYGDALEEHGFEKVVSHEQGQVYPPNGEAYPPPDYSAAAGDVAVIQDVTGHPHGHMEMYSGTEWISYYHQDDKFFPHRNYAAVKPRYAIYRLK